MDTGEYIKPQEFNFLDPRLHVTLTISDEAYAHFPEVTPRDLETKQEHYRLLLGNCERVGPMAARVNIQATAEIPPDDPANPVLYIESREIVKSPKIGKIRTFLEQVRLVPGMENLELVGDLHTHPVTQSELDSDQVPWLYSPSDVVDLASQYEQGNIPATKPFIFIIAGAYKNGQTGYGFYRLVKTGDEYSVQKVTEA